MREAMLEYGFDIYPVADGLIHRFKGPDDKKSNGWYVFHGDHGAFGNWKTNLKVPWAERESRMDAGTYRRLVQQERRERRRAEALKHSEAATQARSIWAKVEPAIEHPYLTRKQVQPHGVRLQGDRLVVPMTIDTKIHSLQFIYPDGFKKFMTGGRVKGCYCPIGKLMNQIWIAEGFATAATVHEVTGDSSVCAFNASNLVAVTKHFVEMGLWVCVAADNDKAGWEAAEKAMSLGAEYRVAPEFSDGQTGTDWNDYCILNGAESTNKELSNA